MNKFFFLPTEVAYGMIILLIIAFGWLSLGYKLLVGVLCFVIGYAFRRKSVPYRDTLKNDGEIFLSPVFGEVKSIRQNVPFSFNDESGFEVRIAISGWDEKGLYLPTSGEVSFLKANKGIRISREADATEFYRPVDEIAHTDFVLTSKNQTKTLMRFIDGQYGKRPTIWLKSGDRGRGAACFGYYPFGGSLLIYLPRNSDILVFEKERLIPGQSVIAALKEAK